MQNRCVTRHGMAQVVILFCNDRNKRTTRHTCTWPFFSGYAYITLILHTINYNDNNWLQQPMNKKTTTWNKSAKAKVFYFLIILCVCLFRCRLAFWLAGCWTIDPFQFPICNWILQTERVARAPWRTLIYALSLPKRVVDWTAVRSRYVAMKDKFLG